MLPLSSWGAGHASGPPTGQWWGERERRGRRPQVCSVWDGSVKPAACALCPLEPQGWGLGPRGTGATGLPGRVAEDSPFLAGPSARIRFPPAMSGRAVPTLRPHGSCAGQGVPGGWSPARAPIGRDWAGGRGQGRAGKLLEALLGPAVPLPSCPLHSWSSYFQAVPGRGPGPGLPWALVEMGGQVWASRARAVGPLTGAAATPPRAMLREGVSACLCACV